MIKNYHITLTQGRGDSFSVQAVSLSALKNFYATVSTAVLSSIKEIVVSKEHGVQAELLPNTHTIEPTYKSVEVWCKSNSYSKVFTLRDVKKSVTKDILTKSFKTLMIHDEPIIDVYNILALDHSEGVARLSNNMYQLIYKLNSKTHTIELEARSEKECIQHFKDCMSGELVEIRKHLHKDDTVKKDDGDYVKYKTCLMKNDNRDIFSLRVPKVKKNLDSNSIDSLIFSTFKVNNESVKSVQITTNF